MKHFILFLLTSLTYTLAVKAQNTQEEFYKNINGEQKPLSEIIEDAQRSIAIHEVEIPPLIYTLEDTFLNPDYKKENGRYYITTEIKKIIAKDNSYFAIRTIIYFEGIEEYSIPKLVNLDVAFTESLSKMELNKKLLENNLSAKNFICSLFSTTKKVDCKYEEYWGD